MIRVLQAFTHHLPATPGGKCPATEEERAFREKHKPEFDAMKAEEDAMAEELRGKPGSFTLKYGILNADLVLRL